MSDSRIYQHYLYLAGIQVPLISDVISSQFGSLASANIEVQYSPFILNIHEYTKVQIFEQINDNGVLLDPTLEFDGIVIGITKNKNVLGEVSARLTCLTDGVIWNQRKQYDFYINNILNVDTRGTDTEKNMRADGSIDNYFQGILQGNKFDVGCAVSSLLTSRSHAKPGATVELQDANQKKYQSATASHSYYEYIYNGKAFYKNLLNESDQTGTQSVTPFYYERFLTEYHLANKVYGISTSTDVKEFFQQDNFANLITNQINDLQGENSFWTIAGAVLKYGFYNMYDIPNPTYIKKGNNPAPAKEGKHGYNLNDVTGAAEGTTVAHTDYTSSLNISDGIEGKQTIRNDREYSGLGEYLLKPISVLGIPYKCNVIWPDQVVQESLFYDLINTPTRILYQQQCLPGLSSDVVLTTNMFVGPHFIEPNAASNYFTAFNTPNISINDTSIRPQIIYSDYEKEYGLRAQRVNLSYAFDTALLNRNDLTVKQVNEKLNNFLNYEFTHRFLSSRNYSLQVTPDVSIIAGMSTVVLNNEGQHVLCFCTGIQKTWYTSGQKSVQISVAYPRYYYENIGALGNIIDPVSRDPIAIKELNTIIGSEPLDGIVKPNNVIDSSSTNIESIIEDLFKNYNTNSDVSTLKSKYRRQVCTYKDFYELHGKTFYTNLLYSYPDGLFDSTTKANALSTHVFKVFYNDGNNRSIATYNVDHTMSNRDIIEKHLEWTKEGQRI